MKDVYDLLRQKEDHMARLQQEVEALRLVAPMLTDAETEEQNHDATRAAQQLIEDLRAKDTQHDRPALGNRAKNWLSRRGS